MIEKKKTNKLWVSIKRSGHGIINPFKRIYAQIFKIKTRGAKVLVLNEDKFLFVRLGYAHKKWTLPGGRVDKGETFKEAGLRELFEETGIKLSEIEYIGGYEHFVRGRDDTVECFCGSVSIPKVLIDDFEIVDAIWASEDELPEPRHECVDRILGFYKNRAI